MEKFAVDLDKVLDELEFNEDRAENLMTSGNRRHLSSVSPSVTQDHGAVPVPHFNSHAPLESGDHGTKWRPKPVPVSQKTSVSGVFSSLNEYLNSGRVKPAPHSTRDLEDGSSQPEGVHFPISVEPPVDSSVAATAQGAGTLLTSSVSNETPHNHDSHNTSSTVFPDISTAGAFANLASLDEIGNMVSHNGCSSDLTSNDISGGAFVNASDVNRVNTCETVEANTSGLTGIDVSNFPEEDEANSPEDLHDTPVVVRDMVKLDEDMTLSSTLSESQNAVLGFGTLALSKELHDDELIDYLSDLELEEQEHEQERQSTSERSKSQECDNSFGAESQSGSQIQISRSKKSIEADTVLVTDPQVKALDDVEDELKVHGDSASSPPGQPSPVHPIHDESVVSQTSAKEPSLKHFTGVSKSEIPEELIIPEDCSENTLIDTSSLKISASSSESSFVEPHETKTTPQVLHESPCQVTSTSVVESSENFSTERRESFSCNSEAYAKDLNEKPRESNGNLSTAGVSNVNVTGSESRALTEPNIELNPSETRCKNEDGITEDVAVGFGIAGEDPEKRIGESNTQESTNFEVDRSVPLTLSIGDTFSPESNSSPPTPPTVPVTPTLEDQPALDDLASTVSTNSTPFMTPTAGVSQSSTFDEENCPEVIAIPFSPSSHHASDGEVGVSSSSDLCQRPIRPSSLEIPVRTEPAQEETAGSSEDSPVAFNATVGPPGATPSANAPTASMAESLGEQQGTDESATESSMDEALCGAGAVGGEEPPSSNPVEETLLGKEPPFWVPDADAPCCMQCDFKFTVLKRRHHCRACGKVLCSKCCCEKAYLEYINAEARVCFSCKSILLGAEVGSPVSPQRPNPNPNNPMEYCSTVPPLLQAAGSSNQNTPTVMVPVGVLKREGSTKPKSEAKQVMFSDGIRPGADLAELDGSSEPRLSIRRTGRTSKRVGTPPGNACSSQRTLPQLDPTTLSYVPHGKGLPPVVIKGKDGIQYEEDPDPARLMAVIRDEAAPPVKFTINRNLYVLVKILNLDCCVNRICWCFTSDGLSSVGQDEIVIILEVESEPEESSVPKDVFIHLNMLFMEAAKGNTVTEMGHTLTQGSLFLGSKEHGGFLYVRPTFQCLHRLILPPAPYLVGVLIHKWETPWARVFPIRLMLRLGAEFRYYPCPLVSIRQRSAVYGEIGHTIIQVLADFRNMAYTLPTVRGLVIHMEDKQTSILLPRNRYDQVMRALNNSNDHVLAFGANFSQAADSHLVCMQSDTDHSYHTQAINIHNKPRKVTGASFVVFNGALKASCGMAAKSSIVEDGLMVKVTGETMASLKTALRDMKDLSITCGLINPPAEVSNSGGAISISDEVVVIKWAEDDRSFNIGVLSSVDGRALDGVPSIRVHNGTDYHGECRFIRWTEVFILESEEGSGRTGDPVDISRLSEQLAKATCLALVKLLDLLASANLTTLAVRATIHPENVGYQAGSNGEKLPPIYMNSLDDELVPVLHEAGLMSGESPAVLELVFRIMESG